MMAGKPITTALNYHLARNNQPEAGNKKPRRLGMVRRNLQQFGEMLP